MQRYLVALLAVVLSFPISTQAADNTWTNVGGTSAWNLIDPNWTSPTIWDNTSASANVAVFGPTGAGVVTVDSGINVRGISFTADGYHLTGGDITFHNTGSGSVGAGQVSVAAGTHE
jgi:hypothetical protein